MAKLAINGGIPLRNTPYPAYISIGEEERKAVMEVLDSTVLSQYLGTWSKDFYGGPRVNQLEKDWCKYFYVKYAVSVNSATSGLYAAVGAAGIGPGDEVIVSPYTMSASATAAMIYGGIPVFADIDEDIFCITPESIKKCITPYTKAIIVVDIFGHPADMQEIMEIAHERDLVVIEDAAQAPGATYKGKYAGTLADMGVFSLNYHKTIHCGEGGVVVTDDDVYAERLQLIRNHAEVVVKNKGVKNVVNLLGFNYRMTEIEAAIATEQLKKLTSLLIPRRRIAEILTKQLSAMDGLTPPHVHRDVQHGYYVYPIKYNKKILGIPREKFVAAINAEGIPLINGYQEPLYLQPCYQQQIGFGDKGYPFTYPGYQGKTNYRQGICPITERMYYHEFMYTNICHAGLDDESLNDFITGVEKVINNIKELK